MPKTKTEKEKIVKDLVDLFKRMKSAVFIDFKGLKVKEITELRQLCRQAGISYAVAKKTLLKIASKESGLDFDPHSVKGSFATAFGLADEAAPAKVLADFAKTHEALKILGGFLESKVVSQETILSLAKLPAKSELLAKLVGSIQAPLAGLVNVCAGNLRGLVNVLEAYKDKQSV